MLGRTVRHSLFLGAAAAALSITGCDEAAGGSPGGAAPPPGLLGDGSAGTGGTGGTGTGGVGASGTGSSSGVTAGAGAGTTSPGDPWTPASGNDAGAGSSSSGSGLPEYRPDVTPDHGSKSLRPGTAYGDWTYVEVDGAVCRDGSPAGYYYREGSSDNLHIFMNGGGACADPFFCSLNPANVDEDLPHERLINATGNLLIGPDPIRQVPPNSGIFKKDPANPVADWNSIYIPYCTGDVHGGTQRDVMVPGAEVEGLNQFVGYINMGLFLEDFGPALPKADDILLSGSSAGSFAVLMNADRVQEFFNPYDSVVHVIADSGVPMRDSVDGVDYMAVCLQQNWRSLWGLDAWLPEDCEGCRRSDGGGLVEGLGDYLFKKKYTDRVLGGLVTSKEDNVMRGFFGAGGNPNDPNSTCSNTDPGINVVIEATIGGAYSGPTYTKGIRDALKNVTGENAVGYYLMPGDLHIHLWRDRFYQDNGQGKTIAAWVGEVLAGKASHVGQL